MRFKEALVLSLVCGLAAACDSDDDDKSGEDQPISEVCRIGCARIAECVDPPARQVEACLATCSAATTPEPLECVLEATCGDIPACFANVEPGEEEQPGAATSEQCRAFCEDHVECDAMGHEVSDAELSWATFQCEVHCLSSLPAEIVMCGESESCDTFLPCTLKHFRAG